MKVLGAIAILFAVFIAMPGAAKAQAWSAKTQDDGGFAAGFVSYPGLGAGFTCTARSVQNRPIIDTGWFEVTTAGPWQWLLSFGEGLIPAVAPYSRGDLVFYVGETGYRLPLTNHNEIESGWQVTVSMADGLFAALRNADRLVLAVGAEQAWELPTAGLAGALEQARDFCAATWAVTGPPAPPALRGDAPGAAGSDLRAIAERFVATNCSDFFSPGPYAFLSGDIDGDGQPDLVVDYNDITCNNEARRPGNCGASMCSVDVFLSGSFARTGKPEYLLGTSAALVPLDNGNMAVGTSGNLAACQSLEPCAFYFYWNGSELTELAQ